MPRPTAKGFPCKPSECYASRHLEGPDYKIWDIMLAASPRKDGERRFYASVEPWLCNAANQFQSTVKATMDRLEKAGWIICVEKDRIGSNGKKLPNVYRVLDHDEYVALHPGSCPDYKMAPDYGTAAKHGVEKGDRIPTGRSIWNFIKDKPALPSATRDAIIEVMESLTEAEREEVLEHWKAAVPGQPEEALPSPVDRDQPRSTGDGTVPGRPVLPSPVDRKNQPRSTGENPSRSNLVRVTDNTIPDENRAGVVVVTAAARPSPKDLNDALERVIRIFIDQEKEAPTTTKDQDRQIKQWIERDGEEMVEKILRRDLEDAPFWVGKDGTRTTLPLARFVKRYERLKAEIEARKPSQKMSEAQHERISRISRIRHATMFSSCNAEEIAKLQEINDRDTWTEEEIDRGLAIIRQADYRHEDEKNDDPKPPPDDGDIPF